MLYLSQIIREESGNYVNLLITSFALDSAISTNYITYSILTYAIKLTKKREIYVNSKVKFLRLQNTWDAHVSRKAGWGGTHTPRALTGPCFS